MKLRTLLPLIALIVVGALGLAASSGDDESAETTTPAPAGDTGGMEDPAADIDVMSPAADLRVTLDRLLAEHGELAIFAMQKGFDGSNDFEAIAAALDENTVALREAIGSVCGDEAEQAFLKMWREHIGFFVEYTVATAEDDQQGRKAALDQLARYRRSSPSCSATHRAPGRRDLRGPPGPRRPADDGTRPVRRGRLRGRLRYRA
jgi:hypothetical protein